MRQRDPLSRRSFLAGASVGAVGGLAGCLDRIRGASGRSEPSQISLSIKTLPADEDEKAIQIARRLSDNLEAAGIDVTLTVLAERALLTEVLYNHDFDVFIAPFPGIDDPDRLRPLLHSQFAEESGWQNPFGFTSTQVDELLESQLEEPPAFRTETLNELQRALLREQPFSVVAYPDYAVAVAEWVTNEWNLLGLSSFESLLQINPDVSERQLVRIGVLTKHITENRNPLAAEYRSRDNVLELIYDPLIKQTAEGLVPWLATEWQINNRELTVSLRQDVEWHDGESLTADDIAFTYRLLMDTSDGNADIPIPAPRFRGRTSRLDSVSVLDDTTVSITATTGTEDRVIQLLTLPILPEHIWEDRTDVVQDGLTEAIIAQNDEPIGSGPFQFVDGQRDEFVALERVDGHFIETDPNLGPFTGQVPIKQLEFTVEPNPQWIIERITNDEMAATATPLERELIETVQQTDGVDILSEQTTTFYMIGYNTRRHPLSAHTFRTSLSRLIDRGGVVNDLFDGRAVPADTPLLRSATVPDDVAWTGESAVGSFPGANGELDVDAARALFNDVGFRYNNDGELLTQN